MRIEDLPLKSILEMSREEALERILLIRKSRLENLMKRKAAPKAKPKKPKASAKSKALTPEMAQALLKELGVDS